MEIRSLINLKKFIIHHGMHWWTESMEFEYAWNTQRSACSNGGCSVGLFTGFRVQLDNFFTFLGTIPKNQCQEPFECNGNFWWHFFVADVFFSSAIYCILVRTRSSWTGIIGINCSEHRTLMGLHVSWMPHCLPCFVGRIHVLIRYCILHLRDPLDDLQPCWGCGWIWYGRTSKTWFDFSLFSCALGGSSPVMSLL